MRNSTGFYPRIQVTDSGSVGQTGGAPWTETITATGLAPGNVGGAFLLA